MAKTKSIRPRVDTFIRVMEESFRQSFPTGYISVQPTGGRDYFPPHIYVRFSLLPKGAQQNRIIENDPSYNTFMIYGADGDAFFESPSESQGGDLMSPKLKVEMVQGGRLFGPNHTNSEKVGWRNGTGTPDAILKKFSAYFKKLRSMVDARPDIDLGSTESRKDNGIPVPSRSSRETNPARGSKKLQWTTQGGERVARGPRGTYRIRDQRGRRLYRIELVQYGKSKDVHYGNLVEVKAWANDHAFPCPEVQAILDLMPEDITEKQLQDLIQESKDLDSENVDSEDDALYADWAARQHLVHQKIDAMMDVARALGASEYETAADQRASDLDIEEYRDNVADTAYELWGRGMLFKAANLGFEEAEEYDRAEGDRSDNPADIRKIKSRVMRS